MLGSVENKGVREKGPHIWRCFCGYALGSLCEGIYLLGIHQNLKFRQHLVEATVLRVRRRGAGDKPFR